ncbi:antibiotic biosynthesis monooxygenase [Paracoccaceae bacterium Fryx2]|nr:antibiotic biosynthesis monooxygenase [Paracoccaceae bacterium Fryx2]
MIVLTGRLICADAAEAALVAEHLPRHVALTLAEPGCISFTVVQTADPLVWQVDECFTDRAAFEAHQARTRASMWASATAAIRRDFTTRDTDA